MNTEEPIKELKGNAVLHGVISRLSVKQILEYECHSHWLASYVWFNWGQELISKHIARKVSRKYKRYLYSLDTRSRLLNGL